FSTNECNFTMRICGTNQTESSIRCHSGADDAEEFSIVIQDRRRNNEFIKPVGPALVNLGDVDCSSTLKAYVGPRPPEIISPTEVPLGDLGVAVVAEVCEFCARCIQQEAILEREISRTTNLLEITLQISLILTSEQHGQRRVAGRLLHGAA